MCRFKRGEKNVVLGGGRKELPLTDDHIIGALREAGGIVRQAALLLGVSHTRVYNQMRLNPDHFKEIRKEIEHEMYDLAKNGVRTHLTLQNAKVCMWTMARYESRDIMARFPEGDQTEYMSGGGVGNTYIQQNINIQNNQFITQVNKLCEKATVLGVSQDRVNRIRELQAQLKTQQTGG